MPLLQNVTLTITPVEKMALIESVTHVHRHVFNPCADCTTTDCYNVCEDASRMHRIKRTLESLLRKLKGY